MVKALVTLRNLWPFLLAALKPVLLQKIVEALPELPTVLPRAGKSTPLFPPTCEVTFPWQCLSWENIPIALVSVKQLRLTAEPKEALLPKWLEGAADDSLPTCLFSLRERDWKKIWTRFHQIKLPGTAHEAWYMVLHGLATRPTAHVITERSSYDISTPLCLVCKTKNDFVHAYLTCPVAQLVWEHSWPILRLYCHDIPPWSEIASDGSEILLGFPSLEDKLPIAAKARLRTGFVLILEEYKTCLQSAQGLSDSDAPSRAFNRLRPLWPRIPTKVVRKLFQLALGQRQGPDAISEADFANLWLQGNSLFSLAGDGLALNAEWPSSCDLLANAIDILCPNREETSAVARDSSQNAEAGPSVPPLQRPDPPQQQKWSTGTRDCRCCRIKRRIELSTLLCVPCWQHRFPDVPVGIKAGQFAKFNLSTMKCDCARSVRQLTGSDQNWSLPGNIKVCSCCGKKVRLELNHRLCVRCWPRHFPGDLVQLTASELRQLNKSAHLSVPSTKCSCYG